MFIDRSGDQFDEAARAFGDSYNLSAVAFTPTDQSFFWRQAAIGDTTLSIRKNVILARMDTTLDTGDEFVVAWNQSGRLHLESVDGSAATVLTTPFIMPNGRSATRAIPVDIEQSLIHIDARFVRGVAEELSDARFDTFAVASPSTPSGLASWRRTVGLVSAVLQTGPVDDDSLLRREMARLVAVTMLTVFPYRSHDVRAGVAGSEPASVRLALDFIHSNAHLPISPVEVAQAVGLSVRSLQQAFRRYRESTPTATLHEVRLDRVHTQLLSADRGVDSVSEIAARWGFTHLGRFSAEYRLRFGELPSQTLRNAR